MLSNKYCNSRLEIAIDSILLFAIIAFCIPQIDRIRSLPSTQGISSNYILFNAIFNTSQLSHALFLHAYGWPFERKTVLEAIAESRLQGLAAYGAVLGLLQTFAQWCCSMWLVTAYSQGSTNGKPNGMGTAIQAFLHAAVVLFPAVAIALPKPSPRSWEVGVPMALITMANMILAPIFLLLQYYVQYREYRRQGGDPGALSIASLFIQVPVLLVLGARWFVRLGTPPWMSRDSYGPYFALWVMDMTRALYSWGFLAINYSVCVLGAVFLLNMYLLTNRSSTNGDLEPLLA